MNLLLALGKALTVPEILSIQRPAYKGNTPFEIGPIPFWDKAWLAFSI